jgi:hypothetical protein
MSDDEAESTRLDVVPAFRCDEKKCQVWRRGTSSDGGGRTTSAVFQVANECGYFGKKCHSEDKC